MDNYSNLPKIGDRFVIQGVMKTSDGGYITNCKKGDETIFVNNVTPYFMKDDERFKHADDVEETHINKSDW